jgi:hypothetical protein
MHPLQALFSGGRNQNSWVDGSGYDKIQSMAAVYELMDELITTDLVQRAIDLPQKSNGLRRFCIKMTVYLFLMRWRDDGGHTDISGNGRVSSDADNEK